MICGGSQCGCGLVSGSLQITGDGSPWTIEANAFTVCTSLTRPASPFVNQFIYETDTGLSYRWSGAAWRLFAWDTAPQCIVETSAPTSVPHGGSGAKPAFGTEISDLHGWHSTGTNPTRVTPTIPGIYRVAGWADWESTVNDYTRQLTGPLKNGSNVTPTGRFDHAHAIASAWGATSAAFELWIAANGSTDYFETQAFQTNNATAARTIDVTFVVEWKANL